MGAFAKRNGAEAMAAIPPGAPELTEGKPIQFLRSANIIVLH
jgi:hypothetical protein